MVALIRDICSLPAKTRGFVVLIEVLVVAVWGATWIVAVFASSPILCAALHFPALVFRRGGVAWCAVLAHHTLRTAGSCALARAHVPSVFVVSISCSPVWQWCCLVGICLSGDCGVCDVMFLLVTNTRLLGHVYSYSLSLARDPKSRCPSVSCSAR
jgi:hypothetical protein